MLSTKGYELTVSTYISMKNGFCKNFLFDKALALFSKLEDNGCIPDVVRYDTIADYPFQNDERERL
jgi:pentatricopeptide repeat domain-containing protein 1